MGSFSFCFKKAHEGIAKIIEYFTRGSYYRKVFKIFESYFDKRFNRMVPSFKP